MSTPLHSPPLTSTSLHYRAAGGLRLPDVAVRQKNPVTCCEANPPTPSGSSFLLPKPLPRKPDPVHLEGRGAPRSDGDGGLLFFPEGFIWTSFSCQKALLAAFRAFSLVSMAHEMLMITGRVAITGPIIQNALTTR